MVAACGGEHLIELILTLFIGPGDRVINSVPTFDVFRLRVEILGGEVVEVPRQGDFAVDVAAVKAAVNEKTKMILLATPNNPTGNATPPKHILELVQTGIPVLVDEAYYEFHGETVVHLVSGYPNLMVLRTLSKWAGLAGMRVGYGVFTPRVADLLMQIKPIYEVTAEARIAVRASLEDIDYLKGNIQAIIAERERLYRELSQFSFLRPYPSRANFIFCRVAGDAARLREALLAKGISVCSFSLPSLQDAIRISVGKPEHTQALIRALKDIAPSF